MGSVMKALSRAFNRLARPLAGTGLIGVWGVVVHVGRRSGRRFETPVALAARGDEFFVPLPYGEGTDWCRNILAAGGGIIRYRGQDHEVREPPILASRTCLISAADMPR